ncbi:MAG: glycosyltransferase family 4 protein [Candidatus Omnitrophica bacterium]|nr:glycosyltransferase family 4 protein [Candidatus Omnitrophota bacterium]
MKVLILTTHLNIGGVASYTVNLAKGLQKRSIPVWVASSGGDLKKVLGEHDIPHLQVSVKTKCEFHPKLCFAFFKLLTFVKENKIDIIHAQTRTAQILAYALSKATGAKFISTCHGFFKSKRISRRLFSAWGDSVIAISDAVRDHLIKDFRINHDKVFLIYNGVDTEAFSAEISSDEEMRLKRNLGFAKCPVIGSISRLSPVKGLKYLLFAMKDLLKSVPEAQLLLVGEGPSKDFLTGLAKKLGIENNVFFAESTIRIQRFLSIMDVFVFSSLEEGLGLSLLEALASGKSCVASDVGGVSSIIEDGVTGILVPPKDAHALKEAIERVLNDENLRVSLARNGRDLVKEKFSLDKMIGEVIDAYDKTRK